MKNNNLFVWIMGIVGLLIFLYMIQPVPYCNLIENGNLIVEIPYTVYSNNEIESIMEQTITNGYLMIQTFGDSMYPTILSNSKCECILKSEYNVGDIIVFFNQDNVGVSHRIVYKSGETYITKGDNNLIKDLPINKENIVCSIPEIPRFQLKNR